MDKCWPGLRHVSLLAVMAVVALACSSSSETARRGPEAPEAAPEIQPGTDAGPSASDAPDRTRTTATKSVARAGSPSGRAGSQAPSRTSSSKAPIRIAFSVADTTGFEAVSGTNFGQYQDENSEQFADAQLRDFQYLVKWANKNGGVGGRKIVAIPIRYLVTDVLDPNKMVGYCVRATEDERARAYIDYSQMWFNEAAVACFAQHKVTFVGPMSASTSSFVKRYTPYLGSTSATADRGARVFVEGLQRAGYFTGGTVGVVRADTPGAKTVYEKVLLPALKAIGKAPVAVATMHHTDAGLMANQAASAIVRFRAMGVDRVIPVFAFFNMLAFFSAADAQGYYPRFGLSDFAGTAANAAFYGSFRQLRDAVAVSSSPSLVLDKKHEEVRNAEGDTDPKDPGLTEGAHRCIRILSQTSKRNYYKASSGRSAAILYYCENFLLWLEASRKVGASMAPGNWGRGLAALGTSYKSSLLHSTSFRPGRFDGLSSYRTGVWSTVEGCRCYIARGGWQPLP